jgi:hypothetical protein
VGSRLAAGACRRAYFRAAKRNGSKVRPLPTSQPTNKHGDLVLAPTSSSDSRLSISHTLHSYHANDTAPWIIHHHRRLRLRPTKHLRLRRPALMRLLLLHHLHPKTSRSAQRNPPRRSKRDGARRGSCHRRRKRSSRCSKRKSGQTGQSSSPKRNASAGRWRSWRRNERRSRSHATAERVSRMKRNSVQ